jgi:hypothetical protein
MPSEETEVRSGENSEERLLQWHRLFGLMLADQLDPSMFHVELEKDMSLQQQLLDVVVVRRDPGSAVSDEQLPDGFDFVEHNLITFKSFHEPLDDWALKELTSHYVAYRKMISEDRLLPEAQFGLYAVCARTPQKLQREFDIQTLAPGVLEARRGTDRIRIIVANDIPMAEQNSPLLLFSSQIKRVEYGRKMLRMKSETSGRIVNVLFGNYPVEGMKVPYTLEQFRKEYDEKLVERLTIEQRVKGLKPEEYVIAIKPEDYLKVLKPEERIQGMKPEERLQGMKPEERLQGMKPEERLQGMKPEDIAKALSPEDIQRLLNSLQSNSTKVD